MYGLENLLDEKDINPYLHRKLLHFKQNIEAIHMILFTCWSIYIFLLGVCVDFPIGFHLS